MCISGKKDWQDKKSFTEGGWEGQEDGEVLGQKWEDGEEKIHQWKIPLLSKKAISSERHPCLV